jgi:hypothetical protein
MVNVLLDIEILSRRVSVGVWNEAVPSREVAGIIGDAVAWTER